MRIGVVSDTHNNLRNVRRIVELFNEAGVDRVVHTGDITQAKVLHALSELEAPLIGVYGNNDRERDSLEEAARTHGFTLAEPPLRVTWHARRIVIVHEPHQLGWVGEEAHALALHGHTHLRRIERTGRRLVFNPGESAGHMQGHNAIGIVDLERLEPEIVLF
jgi:putative phosphoesterase